MSELPKTPALVHYEIAADRAKAHIFSITLTISNPSTEQEVSLPVWIPGSYLIREFSKNLQNLTAHQNSRTVRVEQRNKHGWLIDCSSGQTLTLQYEICAYDRSVRTAWLDEQRGFFNGTSLCLRVHGHENHAHTIAIRTPSHAPYWQLATALIPLKIDASGFGTYGAQNYDELVDSPVEMGTFWHGQFKVMGAQHHFIVSGAASSFDADRLLKDTQKIVNAAIYFWHGKGKPPFSNYWFILNAVHDGYGGLEHRFSTALICQRRDLPRLGDNSTSDGYITLLGLISHEYFHTWNVKRLRPAEFTNYNYDQENYTKLLWFFEGFTSYYDDLMLRRAGLIDDATYLKLLGKTIQQVLQAPGSQIQSVAEASFDAWIKYYRADENTPNSTISYYTKGALVALCIDLTLRRCSANSLDDAMRMLWKRCAGGSMTEDDVRTVLSALAGRSLDDELDMWIHGTEVLPITELLESIGVSVQSEIAQPAQRLGIRVLENHSVQIKLVLRDSWAEQAGFCAGDEWFGVSIDSQSWRIQRIEDVYFYAGQATHCTAWVARDGKILQMPLQLGLPKTTAKETKLRKKHQHSSAATANNDTISLRIADSHRMSTWLTGQST